MDPTPGILRVQSRGYDDDADRDDESQVSGSALTDEFDDGTEQVEMFDRHIEEAISFAQSLSKTCQDKSERSMQQMKFVDDRKAQWDKQTWDGQTFLHALAYLNSDRKLATNLQWLMSQVMFRMPELMGRMDHTNQTPLTVALATGNEAFSYAACHNLSDAAKNCFKEFLEVECANLGGEDNPTCLHMALATSKMSSESLRQGIVRSMCSFVPEQMFAVKDNRGRTPLHLAIEYERCCKGQAGVVDELLRWGPQALEIPIPATVYSSSTQSAYQYHMYTRKQSEAKRAANEELRRKQAQAKSKHHDRKDPRAISKSAKSAPESEKGNMGPPPRPRDRDEPGIGISRTYTQSQEDKSSSPHSTNLEKEKGVSYSASLHRGVAQSQEVKSSSLHSINLGNEKGTSYSGAKTGPPSSSSLHPGASSRAEANSSAPRRKAASNSTTQKETERRAEADRITDALKLEYLRTQDPETVAQSLNVDGKMSKELWFDFGAPRKLTKENFIACFKHLQFDRVLQYVAFPEIKFEGQEQTSDPRYAGRGDMMFFFDWLKQKGVNKIIKVIVEDMESPSHSDEAIEKALKPFDVEILDWRRVDLDPTSLSEIGQCLREVRLYWSGRNSVLRAWSEPGGLALVPTLNQIDLIQIKGLESSQRTERNIYAFEERLQASWPSSKAWPTVNSPRFGGGRFIRGQSADILLGRQKQPVDPHRWMQSMTNFADHFRHISDLRNKVNDPSLEPVQVALIDDGAEINRNDLVDIKGQKFPGKSFCYYQDGSIRRASPYWNSSSGHGTLMARLIHKICPSAIIHVIKLQTYAVENSDKLQIDTDSAIKAIEYASERGAQIISMSWTITPPEGERRRRFDDAIYNALKVKGILVFCAASDQGKSADVTYPYGSNNASFRIGAAKATGGMAETVGDANGLDFIFPGHQVVTNGSEDSSYDSDLQEFEPQSGSSVATALAAGLAALIIECVRLGVFYTNKTNPVDPNTAIRKDDLVKICQRENMKSAMESIGTSRHTDGKYIEVWHRFDPVAEYLRRKDGSDIDQLEKIATLARHFFQKGLGYE
ncbi:hypothetical protein F66182_7915 [Fusarium sp. NRRL 66182]|nr:hypothetical protein F66182_7915 [Fusarium sp. NRRL 66182]